MSFFFSPPHCFLHVTLRLPPLHHFPLSGWECDTIRKLLIREELLGCVSHHSSPVTSTHLSWTVGKKSALMLFQVDCYYNICVSPYRKLQKLAKWLTDQKIVLILVLIIGPVFDSSCTDHEVSVVPSNLKKDFVTVHRTIHSSPDVLCREQGLSFSYFPCNRFVFNWMWR